MGQKSKEIPINKSIDEGVIFGGRRKKHGDYVISTVDGHSTLFSILGGKYIEDKLPGNDSDIYLFSYN